MGQRTEPLGTSISVIPILHIPFIELAL